MRPYNNYMHPHTIDLSGRKLENLPRNLSQLIDLQLNGLRIPDKQRKRTRRTALTKRQIILNCSDNQISRIPSRLSNKIIAIDCQNNLITKLPERLPKYLVSSNLHNNMIVELPKRFPEFMREFVGLEQNRMLANEPPRVIGKPTYWSQ
jgi:hypothetical protein